MIRRINSLPLGELLLERGIINQSQLDQSLNVQGERGGLIGEILVALGSVKEDDIAQTLTAQYGFPYLPLGNYNVAADVIGTIPGRIVRQYLLVPVEKIGNNLTLVMSDPLNTQAIEEVESLSGCTVQAFVSTASEIKKAIEKFYKDKE
jgi:type IV pilus assembly protein PilB